MTKDEKEFVKKVLSKWGCDKKIIEFEYAEIRRLKEIIRGMADIRGMVYSHSPKNRSTESPVERNIIHSVELCEKRIEKINNRIKKYIDDKKYLDDIISGLDFDQQFIIKAKYQENLDWEHIKRKYPYEMSMRNFYRIHNEALNNIYKKLKCENYDNIY